MMNGPVDLNEEDQPYLEKKLKLVVNNTDKGGKEPYGTDWLSNLTLGTIFLIEEKANNSNFTKLNFMLPKFVIFGKDIGINGKNYSYVAPVINNKLPTEEEAFPVSNLRFCSQWELIDTIGIYINEEEDE